MLWGTTQRILTGELGVHLRGTLLLNSSLLHWDSCSVVSFSFQEPTLIPYLTAEENVLIAGGDARKARELFERFGLADKRWELPAKLSGGERKRVDLIRALSRDAPLLVHDEPFAYLDEDLKKIVKELVAGY